MDDLDKIAGRVAERSKARSIRHRYATIFVKVALLVGGSFLAGVSQYTQFPAQGVPSSWQIVGLTVTALIAVGGVFLAITDADASRELEIARAAVEQARRYGSVLEEFDRYEKDLSRTTELYSAISAMREVIEQTFRIGGKDALAAVNTIIESSSRSLSVAFGFDQADRWTICIFQAQPNSSTGDIELVCVAHERAIKCDLSQARKWPDGVGTAGMAYANEREIIVPDMSAPELGSLFDLGDRKRDYDADRYRSIAAVPIRVARDTKPWGVVVATNDRANHFSIERKPGIHPAEAARALAAMVGLAVLVSSEQKKAPVVS